MLAYYSLKLELENRPVYIGVEDNTPMFSDENRLYDPEFGEMTGVIKIEDMIPYNPQK